MCGDKSDQTSAEAQLQVERIRMGVNTDVRPEVSFDQPGLPSVQDLMVEQMANAELVITGRMLA